MNWGDVMRYEITVAVRFAYKQFVGVVGADSPERAKEIGLRIFSEEYPIYRYHCRLYVRPIIETA